MSLSETQPSLANEATILPWPQSSLNNYALDIAFYYSGFSSETNNPQIILKDQFSLDSNPDKFISLASKMTEYIDRITRRQSKNPNLDSIASDPDLIKFLTLDFLLSHPSNSIDLSKLLQSFQSKFPNLPASEIWAEMGVIVDYIETKGSRCNGGTGFGPDSPSYKRYSKQIREALVSLYLYS